MSDERPTFGSLFAGIGGIDLGLERAGWKCRWQVEWDAYCQRVLAKHWPDVPRYGDITQVDWSGVEPVDLIAGGFPCQPVSIAGRQHAQDDDRWLWPEFARCIRELRPGYVLVENVRNLLAVNDGRALGEVLGDLAALGYDAEWDCIPAAAVGAPHLRDRVWIVAARTEQRRLLADADDRRSRHAVRAGGDATRDGGADVADAERVRSGRVSDIAARNDRYGPDTGRSEASGWTAGGRAAGVVADSPGERLEGRLGSEMGRGHDGPVEAKESRFTRRGDPRRAAAQWATEPDVGRVAHGVPARVDRLRALGNAVVPQVVEVIGSRLLAILEAEKAA